VEKRRHYKSRGLYFLLRKRKGKSTIGNRICVHHRKVSAVKRVEFVNGGMSHIFMSGR
jgi:hypothetical protein